MICKIALNDKAIVDQTRQKLITIHDAQKL
jgi:hypothetical protein